MARLKSLLFLRTQHYAQPFILDIIFSPLTFSQYDGNGTEAEQFLTELTLKLSPKKQVGYTIVISWLRTKLSYNLLRSAVLCVNALEGSSSVDNSSIALHLIGPISVWSQSMECNANTL